MRGEESLIPGLLEKTIKAIQILHSDKYDFIVRSNLSTIIDFYRLREILESQENIDYLGGQILENTEALQSGSGRKDPSLLGVKFAAGTMILLSSSLVQKIMLSRDKFRFDVIDDLSIGSLINIMFNDIYIYSLRLQLFTVNA